MDEQDNKTKYLNEVLSMLDYLDKNNNGECLYFNAGSKITDWDNFIIKHRIVIEKYKPFTRVWNAHASRIKTVFDELKKALK